VDKEYELQQFLKWEGGWEALFYSMTTEERIAMYDRMVASGRLTPDAPDGAVCSCEYVLGEYGGRIPNNDCPVHSPRP
jgi:hypothetical protein